MKARVSAATMLAGALAICSSSGSAAWAQNPTGTLTGQVSSNDGSELPGVTVTATSPNLQGERSTVTGPNGDYKIALLPAGTYIVKYELEGLAPVEREIKISAAQTSLQDVDMTVAGVAEEIFVTSESATISETPTTQSTFTKDEVEQLAIGRNVLDTVNLAAGVSATGPFNGATPATTISGAMSFENLWMVNGVVVNENLRGQPLDLFIEDAIQETTVTTAGVSAEYGRFTGGVVNVLTKSGGNQFHGSLRSNMTNQDWESDKVDQEFNPDFESDDEINETYEATLGGPIWKDRIWFFLAGRDVETAATEQTAQTFVSFATGREQERYEGKLTVNLSQSHTLIGSYLEIDDVIVGDFFPQEPLDTNVLTNREDPQEIKSANYNGVITSNFFLEGQYSERDWEVAVGAGGPRDLYSGSPWETTIDYTGWHAPNFCGGCEQEVRNNENWLAKGSYFLSTESAGTHDFVFGYDTFKDVRFSVNHQSGSDFRLAAEGYFFDAQNNVYPILSGEGSAWVSVWPVFGLDRVTPTDFNTNSFYVNDRWQLNDHWSFNVGVRYDENDGTDAGGNLVTDDSKVSPRVAASYDLKGDGDLVFNASYGTYVAAIASGRADDAATGGAIGLSLLFYGGAPINPDGEACLATGTCIDSRTAAQMAVDWWIATTGFNPLTDRPEEIAGIPDPLGVLVLPAEESNRIVPSSIVSPSADDFTLGLTKRLGTRGLLRADAIYRTWNDFYANRIRPNNTIVIEGNELDIEEIGNFDSGLERDYTALQSSFRYRITDRLTTAATYTLSKLEGNFNGENANTGPLAGDPQERAEYKESRWNTPVGDLGADQRHKLRAWAIYDLLQGERHHLSVSLLESFLSGTPYGAAGNIDPSPFVVNPGYVNESGQEGYFFTGRDEFHTDDITRTDLALNYSFTIGRGFEIFLQPEILNLFDENGAVDVNQAVLTALDGAACSNGPGGNCAPFNPFNATPVENVNFVKGQQFGQPTNADDFQLPRTFRFSVGFRF